MKAPRLRPRRFYLNPMYNARVVNRCRVWTTGRRCYLKTLLRLQQIDLAIERCRAQELEIPKQKEKFEVQRKRLAAELTEREQARKKLELEQRNCESEIEQKQAQIIKYEQQLMTIKENDQYQALLHEIDFLKKQISQNEERIIAILMEIDDANARLQEDRQRINLEVKEIERQCSEIDKELAEAIAKREELEAQRAPLLKDVEEVLLSQYKRIRSSKKTGPAAVPLHGEVCSGCNMTIRPQIINEVMAGEKIHSCNHCGRILYYKENFENQNSQAGIV